MELPQLCHITRLRRSPPCLRAPQYVKAIEGNASLLCRLRRQRHAGPINRSISIFEIALLAPQMNNLAAPERSAIDKITPGRLCHESDERSVRRLRGPLQAR